ncbi:Acetyltransferase (GNAT) [Gracilaria domingensis]|nr:Acetyltransferase (GNAT) [Gracilaria domingensis]
MDSVPPVSIRRVEEADLERGFFDVLAQLTKAPPLSPQQFSRLVRVQRELDVQLTLVAVRDGTVVGTASVLIEPKFIRGGRPCAHIEDVVIDASLRGMGVGKRLIQQLLAYAVEKGCYKVILDCAPDNVPFYHKCGFQQKETQMALYLS